MIAASLLARAALAALFAPTAALAPPGLGDLETHADDVTIDTERRELLLRGRVTVEASPFHLRSDELRLRRTGYGIEILGDGKLAFCPCLGTPLTLSFKEVLVGPPSDLILKAPRLEVYGVPVMALPYFWLRGAERPGLLPPVLAYRAKDGLFAGAGVHLPWWSFDRTRPVAPEDRELGLDLRGGAYFVGGAAVDAELRAPRSRTRMRVDWLGGSGVAVDARGSHGAMSGAAWDVDAMRGARALASTSSLDDAARPLDRLRGETFAREGPLSASAAITGTIVRGADTETGSYGPSFELALADALARGVSAGARLRAGALSRPGEAPMTVVGASARASMARPLGVLAARVDAGAEGSHVATSFGAADLATASGQVRVGVPLVRSYASADVADPWRHRVEPQVGVLAYAAARRDAVDGLARAGFLRSAFDVQALGEGISVAPLVGASSALGRYGARDGAEVDAGLGYAVSSEEPFSRLKIAAGGTFVLVGLEAGATLSARPGVAGSLRARLGAVERLHLEGRLGGRGGADPTLARLLSPSFALAMPGVRYFAGDGLSAGAAVVVPWTRHLTTRAGADFDAVSKTLLGARASIDLRDGCGCVTLRLFGSQRLGRDGVDVWLALELGETVIR